MARPLRAVLLLGGLAMLLAACSVAGPTQGAPQDEWTVAISEEQLGYEPLMPSPGSVYWQVNRHVFEPLVDFEGPELKPVGRLAERWEQVDPLTLRFYLRQGVKFQNGDPFTAEDVVYNVEGHRAEPRLGTAYVFETVQRVEVLDANTVQFVTDRPTASLLGNMAQVLLIVPRARERMGAAEFDRKPFGTGPYRYVQTERDKPVLMEANPDYWGPVPSPRRLAFKFVREPSTRVADLRSGAISFAENVPLAQESLLNSGNTQMVSRKAARVIIYNLNWMRRPFDDVRLRQAVNYAIDRDAVIKDVLGGYGWPMAGLFPPGEPGYSADLKPYPYDPAKARELLAAAGHPDGFEFEWQITEGVFQKDREIAEVVGSQLAQVGIRANLRVTERAVLFDNFLAGSYEAISTQWQTTSEPDRYLQWLFLRTQGVREAPEANPGRQLMEEGRTTVDARQRDQVYQRLSRWAQDQGLLMFIHVQDELWGADKRTGWQPWSLRGLATQSFYYRDPGKITK
jgi:peptide/nickel transport system substrate-binding protein